MVETSPGCLEGESGTLRWAFWEVIWELVQALLSLSLAHFWMLCLRNICYEGNQALLRVNPREIGLKPRTKCFYGKHHILLHFSSTGCSPALRSWERLLWHSEVHCWQGISWCQYQKPPGGKWDIPLWVLCAYSDTEVLNCCAVWKPHVVGYTVPQCGMWCQ